MLSNTLKLYKISIKNTLSLQTRHYIFTTFVLYKKSVIEESPQNVNPGLSILLFK